MTSIEAKFEEAVKYIQNLPSDGPYKPSNDTRLKFYGWYKQVKEGKCTTSKPGLLDPVGRSKWDSWNKLGDLSKEEAMKNYVEEFKKVQALADAASNK